MHHAVCDDHPDTHPKPLPDGLHEAHRALVGVAGEADEPPGAAPNVALVDARVRDHDAVVERGDDVRQAPEHLVRVLEDGLAVPRRLQRPVEQSVVVVVVVVVVMIVVIVVVVVVVVVVVTKRKAW